MWWSTSIDQKLYFGAVNGNEKVVRKALKRSTKDDVNWKCKNGRTALVLSALYGHTEVGRMLLAFPGIDVNLHDENGHTALMWASLHGHTSFVEILLSHQDIEVNKQDQDGYSGLIGASLYGYTEIVELILAHPDVQVNLQNKNGHTALMWASLNGHIKIVEMLLAFPGIEINLQDEYGRSALIVATFNGHAKKVEMLLRHQHIQANLSDEDGNTALMWAALYGHFKITALLLAHAGIDVQKRNANGQTALIRASLNGHTSIVKNLLSHSGIEVNSQDKDGLTALMWGSLHGHIPVVQMLLVHGEIELDLQNDEGKTALDLAMNDIVKSLFNTRVNQTSIARSRASASWLAARLRSTGVDEQIVKDCEIKLVVQEGFVAEGDFAELRPSDVDAAYLKSIGILGKGVQNKIIKVHKELHTNYASSAQSQSVPQLTEKPKFMCGSIPIQNVEPLASDLSSRHAISSRIILRGHFTHSTADFSGYKNTKYECVIKCAGDKVDCSPDSEGAKAIQKEYSMYGKVKDIALLKKKNSTGCIACYHMHQSSCYLVLEHYGENISHLLANSSLKFAPQLVEAIIAAVAALHSLDVMHGDIKPQNLLYTLDPARGYLVKLCDLDNSYMVGDICYASALGTSYYESPEVYLASRMGETVVAALSMDIFSLGLVLWQVLSCSLYPPLYSEQTLQCYSDQDKLAACLTLPDESAMYSTLLCSLTRIDPSDRITTDKLLKKICAIAASKAQQNLHKQTQENVYLKEIVSVKLDGLDKQLQVLRQGQEQLGLLVGRVLRTNKKLDSMLHTLISGTHSIPTYAIILPVVAKNWFDKADPMRLVRHQYRLYFLCSHTHQIAPCGPKGEGYRITVTKQWVRDAAPVLMAGLIVVKLALMAGGLPLPIPDLSPLLDTPALHVKYLDAALLSVLNPSEDTKEKADVVMESTLNFLSNVEMEDVLRDHEKGSLSLKEGSLKAYATIQAALQQDCIDIALSSGLRQIVHPISGKTAWVLDDDSVAEQFCGSLSANQKSARDCADNPFDLEDQCNSGTSVHCSCVVS